MTTFLSDIVLAGANDIQFKNTAGANTGKIESDGNNLVLSNAVGDILLGDGSSDVYIGDGTNSVDILFEVSGAISAESGAELTLGGAGGTLALGGAISLADYVSAISATGVNTVDVGTSAKPFKNIYAAHHVGGSSINYATSRGWVEDAAPGGTQSGEFGGDFTINGIGDENAVVWGDDPFNNKALLWKCILNTSANDGDGGWNKNIVIPANNNIGYLSYVYFKTDFTPDNANDGTVYLGGGQTTGQTLNLDGSNNTNPYSTSTDLNGINNGGPVIANRWYVMVGIYQAYNNSTTDNDTVSGVYDVETGEKVQSGGEFKMGNNTTGQVHRAYMYYDTSTDANENVYFWNPGFHAIDGSEPKIQDLVKRQVYLDDNVKAAFGTGNDLEIYHDASNSYIKDSGSGSLYTLTDAYRLTNAAGTENMIWAAENSFVKLYYDNSAKLETVSAGVEITGELQADTLDIDGNADISGDLTGVDTLTATTLSVTNYGLASGDIPNNAADTTGNAATATKISSITNNNIVQLAAIQELTNKTIAASQVTEISNITAAEGAQLENIGSTTISATQWGYLGAATGAITNTDTNTVDMGDGFVIEDGDGTEVTITENKEVKFVEGGGIDINWTDTDNGTDGDPYDLTFTVQTLNQNTTGSAATLTTARTIGGVSFNGSANINLPGVNSAGNQNTSGSAATLTEPRAINGVDFDGSAAITVTAAAGTLSGNTLKSTVVTSSLTSVGSISSGEWRGTSINGAYIANDTINSQHYADGSIDTAHIADDQVTFAKASGVTPNVYNNIIKILPSDFVANDDAGTSKVGIAYKATAGSSYGMKPNATDTELFALVPIPQGMKATHVDVYDKYNKGVIVYEAQINATTLTSKGTGNCNTQIDITDVNSTATNFLAIEVTTTATSDRVFGGQVTIAAI